MRYLGRDFDQRYYIFVFFRSYSTQWSECPEPVPIKLRSVESLSGSSHIYITIPLRGASRWALWGSEEASGWREGPFVPLIRVIDLGGPLKNMGELAVL